VREAAAHWRKFQRFLYARAMSVEVVEGAIFAGRYRLIRRLAAGAMGAVYEARHLGTDRRWALKVMLSHIIERPELRKRFELEARVTAHIDSPFIVEIFDAGVDDATGVPFLVMELLRGEELGRCLRRVGRLSPEETLACLHQTALALDKTHRAGIVHRDLKPANLFLRVGCPGSPALYLMGGGRGCNRDRNTATGGRRVAPAALGSNDATPPIRLDNPVKRYAPRLTGTAWQGRYR
jgi:hypothetical protein